MNKLSKEFGRLVALENVDLEITQGELFGLLGPNGAGKTTLISILSTILPRSSGDATVCGFDVGRQQAQVRKCIGIVFQDPSLDEELTGRENLDFHGRLYGQDSDTRARRSREVLGLVDLSARADDLVKEYSGGMRRRLEIARGLMHTPRVLFLDEPTLGLDPQTRRKIWDYVQTLKESQGMTIILTTHYMDEAERLCDRIAVMDKGRIVVQDTPDALKGSLGGDVVELEVKGSPTRFLELVNGVDAVSKATLTDGRIILAVERGESFVPAAFEMAQAVGLTISSVSMRTPNLEDVFLTLTGRDIRDDTVAEAKERIRIYMTGKRR